MNNPFRKKPGKSVSDVLEELAESIAQLQKENAELRFQCTSLEIENKHRLEKEKKHKEQARMLANRNNELKRELTTLKIRYNITEHREVIKSDIRTQSNGCGA